MSKKECIICNRPAKYTRSGLIFSGKVKISGDYCRKCARDKIETLAVIKKQGDDVWMELK